MGITKEQNELLTRIGPGTPMGNLFRRYWHPVAAASEFEDEVARKVRILGEDLVLYKDKQGRFGLIEEMCPHRKASLVYGIPEEDGIRCPYHGWLIDRHGSCLEMPAEPENTRFKDQIKVAAYKVEELGGLIFAYMGPEPIPLLPRFDLFVYKGLRDIGVNELPCNWLQTMENSVDPVHVEHLHGNYFNFIRERQGEKPRGKAKKHQAIGFDVFEYGIIKKRVLEGGSTESEHWKNGHPLVFPNILRHGSAGRHSMQIRVPVDDTNTKIFWYTCYVPGEGVEVPEQESIPLYDVPLKHPNGKFVVEFIEAQDTMVWVTQGAISDRTTERLGSSDKGIILYRKMLLEQVERIERGEDPIGTVRDPEANTLIELPQETVKFGTDPIGDTWRQYSPIKEQVTELFNKGQWKTDPSHSRFTF